MGSFFKGDELQLHAQHKAAARLCKPGKYMKPQCLAPEPGFSLAARALIHVRNAYRPPLRVPLSKLPKRHVKADNKKRNLQGCTNLEDVRHEALMPKSP